MQVRTRYAPSPTGHVHIGNIRVALFNWLIARHCGGVFLLRIEDTDRERSTPEAIEKNFEAMRWLGIEADEEPVYQSQRREAHLAAAEELLEKGLAYRSDFGSPEKGEAIVFKMPGRDMGFNDEVKGELGKKADDMKDLVIVRGDGNPVFHLANVVDDIFMGVNLVIRGDDHVENTYRHLALYEALGAEPPRFAHLPMIVNAQGKPYSKRDGDAYVGDFKAQGFEAEGLFNYLALLGWSPGDDREVMTREELIAAFDFSGVQSSPAQMDLRKLSWVNGEKLKTLPKEELAAKCREVLVAAKINPDAADFDAVMGLMGERLKLVADMPAQAAYFFGEDFPVDEKQFRKRVQKDGVKELLEAVLAAFQALESWDPAALEQALLPVAESLGMDAGKLNPPLRVAVTGLGGGPGIFETLEILGKDVVLARLARVASSL